MIGEEEGGRVMKKAFLFLATVVVLALASSGWAAVFNVTNETELRSALSTAASNGQNDTINIAAGTYIPDITPFSYTPSLGPPEENYSLTIVGAGIGNTILDGDNIEQVMNIDPRGLADDTNADITVTGITFQRGNNTSSNQAGGLYVRTNQADITVEYCEFFENAGHYGGGALAISAPTALPAPPSGNVTFRNNIFSGNTAGNRGGGAYGNCSSGTLTYSNNIFDGNTANLNGGGALGNSSEGTVIFTNNVFTGNTATTNAGGGAKSYSSTGTIIFTNNTFSGNTAGTVGGYGGGLYISLYQDSATASIYNNIAWNNTTAGSGNDIYVEDDGNGDGTAATVNLYNNNYGPGGNDFGIEVGGSTFHAENNITTDPLFVDVSDPDPSNWDLHLRSTSPCIDAGMNVAPELAATDFEGDPRRIDGNYDGKAKVDIGADEYGPLKLTSPNGGEVIPSGSPFTIQWAAAPEAVDFKLKSSMDNGNTWKPIASGITDTSYGWTVPTPRKNKTQCLVKVIGYDDSEEKVATDESNSAFTIAVVEVTSPNGGETLLSGTPYAIEWETYGTKKPVTKVVLKYTKNGGKTWNKIQILGGNPGLYDWTVPGVPKTKSKCKVKVVLKDAKGNTVGSDTSDGYFTIEP